MKSRRSHLAPVALGCLLTSATAAGQVAPPLETSALLANPRLSQEARQAIRDRVDTVHARFRASHGGLGPEQFGVQCCSITQIPAAAFTTRYGENWTYDYAGYMFPSVTQSDRFAPVQLPSGAQIEYFDLYYFDNDPTVDLYAWLWAYTGGGPFSGEPSVNTLASLTSSGSLGYGYVSGDVDHTVNNDVGYDPDAAQLVAVVGTIGAGIELRFKAVDIWWMRQVSPAPATATFSDVPTNHQFFQFVEALAAAGITAGYPDGRFGVDDSITRGQMAVFLAKALGLYWPH